MTYLRVRFEITEELPEHGKGEPLNETALDWQQALALGRMLSRMTLGDMRTWSLDHAQADVMCDTVERLGAALRATLPKMSCN